MFGIKPSPVTELAGWYGTAALMLAYFLVSFTIVPADGLIFPLLNVTGGLGLMIVAASKKVPQLVLLNVFWVLIGLAAIIRTVQ